jgi:hypothetical protein
MMPQGHRWEDVSKRKFSQKLLRRMLFGPAHPKIAPRTRLVQIRHDGHSLMVKDSSQLAGWKSLFLECFDFLLN